MTRLSQARSMTLIALLVLTACTSAPAPGSASPVPASPSPLAGSPGPVASPRPTFTAGQTVFVENTDRYGAEFRQAPGSAGAVIRVVPDGAVLKATGRSQQIEDRMWSEVDDSTGTVGWVNAEYLSSRPPPLPTPTFMPVGPAPSSSSTPPPIATPLPTPAPAGPRPTDTLVPLMPPGRQPGLAPLPPEATERPLTPTLPPVPAGPPTFDVDEGQPSQATPGRATATAAPTRAPVFTPAPTMTLLPR